MRGQRDQVFFALSDPTRCAILEVLSAGTPLSLAQISRLFSHSVPGTYKHLNVLVEAGLVDTIVVDGGKSYTYRSRALLAALRWLDSIEQKQKNAQSEPISFRDFLKELEAGGE